MNVPKFAIAVFPSPVTVIFPVPVPVDPFSTYIPIEFFAVDNIFISPLFSIFPPFKESIPDKEDPDDIFIIFVTSFMA